MNNKDAILDNMLQMFEQLSNNSPYLNFYCDDHCVRMETDLPLTIFNRVFHYQELKDERIATSRKVKSILDSYRERGVKCVWHSYSHMQDSIVNEILESNGYKLSGTMSGMAVDLHEKTINPFDLPGLRIVTIHTEEELRAFKQVFVSEYNLPEELANAFTGAFTFDPDGRMRYFLAYLNDVPVGTALTFTTGDVSGIYTVATLKEFRRRGIGRALVGHVLQDMQDAGSKLAVLQASTMGQTIYRQHGFEEELTIHLFA